MESTISIALSVTGIYLLLGCLFALVFLWKGVERVDKDAAGSSIFFRVLLFPGMTVFWVIFLIKWLKASNQ